MTTTTADGRVIELKSWGIFAKCGIDVECFKEMCAQLKTTKKVADRLGVSSRSVSWWVRELGIKMPTRKEQGRRKLSFESHTGAVAKWVHEHPGQVLPHSANAIAKIVGCSRESAGMYLTRRKQKVLKWAKNLGRVQELPGSAIDEVGRHIPWRMVRECEYEADGRTLRLTLHLWITQTTVTTVRYTPKQFADLFTSARVE